MEENKTVQERPEKMSYEQLENIAHQLSEQCRQMAESLRERDLTYTFKRLDYLFKVLEFNGSFDFEFVTKCANEIVALMTPPEETPAETAKED